MSIDLKNLNTTTATKPPRILIYGPPGMGKTSLAAEFPAPVIMDLEGGVPQGVNLLSLGDIEEWSQLLDALGALYTQDHDFKTLIVDSLDRVEDLATRQACAENKWNSIEDPGFGKGYVIVADKVRDFIAGCNALRSKCGMTIVHIAHSTVYRFDDPQTAPYSKYDIRMNKHANAIVQDDVDAILFINQDLSVKEEDVGFNKKVRRADGGGFRWIYAEARPAWNAKNRYGMPARFKYDQGKGYAAIQGFLPTQDTQAKPTKKGADNG